MEWTNHLRMVCAVGRWPDPLARMMDLAEQFIAQDADLDEVDVAALDSAEEALDALIAMRKRHLDRYR